MVHINEALFRAKVVETPGCWEWLGSVTGGYGRFGIGSRTDKTRSVERAHRVAWLIYFGEIPEGFHVLHTCDNPPCTRPDHLFLGTQADNNEDKRQKGRASHRPGNKGETNAMAKLTWIQVAEIRALYLAGVSQGNLGRRFQISQSHVHGIVHGEHWALADKSEMM